MQDKCKSTEFIELEGVFRKNYVWVLYEAVRLEYYEAEGFLLCIDKAQSLERELTGIKNKVKST